MPPRKSNVSQVTATGDEGTSQKERDGINIEDLSLPRTMVQRLAKGVLPPNTQIQKDAITAMSKAATVFVNYLSQAANTSPLPTTRKTISPEAVLSALTELEFEPFLPRVQAELHKFNDVQTGKRNEYRRKVKEKETQNGFVNGKTLEEAGEEDQEGIDGSEERAKKRVRREEEEAATGGVAARRPGGAAGSGKAVRLEAETERAGRPERNILAEEEEEEEEEEEGPEDEGEEEERSEEEESEQEEEEEEEEGGGETDSAELEERASRASGNEDEDNDDDDEESD